MFDFLKGVGKWVVGTVVTAGRNEIGARIIPPGGATPPYASWPAPGFSAPAPAIYAPPPAAEDKTTLLLAAGALVVVVLLMTRG